MDKVLAIRVIAGYGDNGERGWNYTGTRFGFADVAAAQSFVDGLLQYGLENGAFGEWRAGRAHMDLGYANTTEYSRIDEQHVYSAEQVNDALSSKEAFETLLNSGGGEYVGLDEEVELGLKAWYSAGKIVMQAANYSIAEVLAQADVAAVELQRRIDEACASDRQVYVLSVYYGGAHAGMPGMQVIQNDTVLLSDVLEDEDEGQTREAAVNLLKWGKGVGMVHEWTDSFDVVADSKEQAAQALRDDDMKSEVIALVGEEYVTDEDRAKDEDDEEGEDDED